MIKYIPFLILGMVMNSLVSQETPYDPPEGNIVDMKAIHLPDINDNGISRMNISLETGYQIGNDGRYIWLGQFRIPSRTSVTISLDTGILPVHSKVYFRNPEIKSYSGPFLVRKDPMDQNMVYGHPQKDTFFIEIDFPSGFHPGLLSDLALSISAGRTAEAFYPDQGDHREKYFPRSERVPPVILLTGYWPPTNEMIRHFSQNESLNPGGWQGEDWESRGYDIISYFPSFADPDCNNCGQGYGDLEVDYQDTSNDYWPITANHTPFAIITFSRGYIDYSWELEFNFYNRTNWIGDYSSPYMPTPNPPDDGEDSYFIRHSNLPMNDIAQAVSALDIGLNPYIDQNGDPGHFVSEFMGYHGVWYRDLNEYGDNPCITAGHVHVGGLIDIETARLAAEETIRQVINYLDQFSYIPGDINQDENINIQDLILAVSIILNTYEPSQAQIYAADMNTDGIINIQDIIIILNMIINEGGLIE